MADRIKIDTAVVAATASMIDKKNIAIREAFSNVEYYMRQLGGYWEGEASMNAQNRFRNIQNNYCEPRYNDIKRLSVFLESQVCEGYEHTERIVSEAAAMFK